MYSMCEDNLQNCFLKNLNKYLHNDTSETEVNINISLNNANEKL